LTPSLRCVCTACHVCCTRALVAPLRVSVASSVRSQTNPEQCATPPSQAPAKQPSQTNHPSQPIALSSIYSPFPRLLVACCTDSKETFKLFSHRRQLSSKARNTMSNANDPVTLSRHILASQVCFNPTRTGLQRL
jgi:hypothetical protein